jgi:NADPH2:quinone reductase
MRAIAIEEFGGPERLQITNLPRPKAAKGEVLIRVVSAGVNPVDWKIREGMLAGLLPHAFPLVPGWDAAGVVEELGEGCERFRKGDRVWSYARKPTVQWGCYAEFVTVPQDHVALMPGKLLYEEAASVPLAALTAFQSLFGRPGLEKDSRVLVHAAAGGVGQFALQLARDAGAEVWGTASAVNHAFVMELGAKTVIDYSKEDFAQTARRDCPNGFDLVLDAVGGDTLERSYDLVRPGGRLVSIVEQVDESRARRRGIGAQMVFVEPDGEQLGFLARLVDEGRLRTHVQKIYTLAQAAEAQSESQAGHVRGKLVLNL